MIDKLINLIKELAEPSGFDIDRIWIRQNFLGEFEIGIDREVWGNGYSFDEAENTIRSIFKGIELSRNSVKLPNGKYLVAEVNNDINYKEIIVGIKTEDGYYLQDLALVGAKYHYDDDSNVIIEDGKYSVKVYNDETREDWQYEYDVNEYKEKGGEIKIWEKQDR